MSTPARTPEAWGEEYRSRLPLHEGFAESLWGLLWVLSGNSGIEIADIERRAKTVDSFVEKIHRKGQKYADPLNDMTDLTATRIIAYYKEDLEPIGELIAAEFEVDWPNSMDPSASMEPDKFGYAAPSYIVQLAEPRRSLPEWALYADIRAEIQVRTIAQHAWAAVDHKLRYKRGGDAPPELQRDLSRLSALFELADKEFSDIRRRSSEIATSYEDRLRSGDLDIDINQESLFAFANLRPLLRPMLYDVGVQAEWRRVESDREEFWRTQSEIGPRVIAAARAANLDSIAHLDEFILRLEEPWVSEALRRIASEADTHGYRPFAVPQDVLSALLLYYARASREDIAEFDVAPQIQEGLADAIADAPDEP